MKTIRHKMLRTLGAFAFAAAFALPASAQDDADATTYDFEDDLVHGDYASPLGEQLVGRRPGRRATLIQIRHHFVPEMLKSVENL